MPIPRVLAIMAHPDDAEILCGGTLALLAKAGWKVHIATMTPGDCGSATLPAKEIALIRRTEASDAAKVFDGEYHCLEERDLQIIYERDALRKVCVLLRLVCPQLVLTHSPSDYMVDHEETSRIVRASCFNSTIPNAPAQPGAFPLEFIPTLYYADPVEGVGPLGEPIRPKILVDVESVMAEKEHALSCHRSQDEWLRAQHGVSHYIESMRAWTQERGRLGDLRFAEGFRQHLGHAFPQSDILSESLPEHARSLGS